MLAFGFRNYETSHLTCCDDLCTMPMSQTEYFRPFPQAAHRPKIENYGNA
jgi:hypothetical protein